MPSQNCVNPRILRINSVCQKTGFARSTIWAKLDPNNSRHDESFPRPFRLSDTSKALGWLESDIDSWILARAENRI